MARKPRTSQDLHDFFSKKKTAFSDIVDHFIFISVNI